MPSRPQATPECGDWRTAALASSMAFATAGSRPSSATAGGSGALGRDQTYQPTPVARSKAARSNVRTSLRLDLRGREPGGAGDYLGLPRFKKEVAFRTSRPGVATGVAWTETGGDVLFIEATLLPGGNQNIILTGQLGNVMQESARAALSHIRAEAAQLGIAPESLDKNDLHVHVPAGAIPKDGRRPGSRWRPPWFRR